MFLSFALDWASEQWASGEGDDNDENVTIQEKKKQLRTFAPRGFVEYSAS